MTATVLNKILRDQERSEGAKRAHKKRKKRGYAADETLYDTKILTMGILTANSLHSLGHPEFLGVFLEKQALPKETQKKIPLVKRAKRKKKTNQWC